MQKRWFLTGLFVILAVCLAPSVTGSASRSNSTTAYGLINAVNALRAPRGISGYRSNSVLMGAAQAQANFLAAIGHGSDYGPGGSTLGQRLPAAGYPLAGDLNAGGLASQNWAEGPDSMTAQAVVHEWTLDALHQIALFSPDLYDIGAGVAGTAGETYYVIVCAAPTGNGQLQAYTPPAGGSAAVPLAMIEPVLLSTPDAHGEIYYVVKPGQALWQIAISYKVKIIDIKNLNGLTSDLIYPGQKLLIQHAPTSTPVPPTAKPTLDLSTFTPLPTLEVVTAVPTDTATLPPVTAPVSGQPGSFVVAAIIVVALAAAGFVAWAGRSRPI